ncbi:MAG TPA: SGNH/GDSL hydrolase family protein [Gemmatimonadales bacterium]|nr:SGNH/GDSL hydrolase family protein [Gemmatimonadales bacterium]
MGVTLLLFLCLEAGYRVAYGAIHQRRDAESSGLNRPDYPYRDSTWYRPWLARREEVFRTATRYDPYRGWKLTAAGEPGLHIDAEGRRVTPQPPAGSAHPRQVFMLGASIMWGYTARDSATIPALVARELARRGVTDVEVVNLGNSGYNVTQEAITLMLELRRGRVPALAVALDGPNDAGAVLLGGAVGDVHDQALAASRFERHGVITDLIQHSELLKRLLILTSGGRPTLGEKACPEVAEYYTRVVAQLEALSQANGFPTYVFSQPLLGRSRKVRTSWERWLDSSNVDFQHMLVTCSLRADSLLQPAMGRTFFPLYDLFDSDTASVFLDHWGHLTEAGNAAIARRIADVITGQLLPISPRRR